MRHMFIPAAALIAGSVIGGPSFAQVIVEQGNPGAAYQDQRAAHIDRRNEHIEQSRANRDNAHGNFAGAVHEERLANRSANSAALAKGAAQQNATRVYVAP